MWVADKPCYFSYDGNPVEWIPYAKHLLMECYKNNWPSQVRTPNTDTYIRVENLNYFGKIYIKTGGCSPFVSGLFDLNLPPKPFFGIPDILFDLEDENRKPYQAVYAFWERKTKDGVDTYLPKSYSRKLANSPIEANKEGTILDDLAFKYAGKYSGEMRKVVQVLVGQGQPVPYEYVWGLTHGIFKSANGTPWVIEISSSHGVRAWKLPVCDSAKTATLKDQNKELMDKLGYWPLNTPDYRKEPTNIKQLMSAGSIKEFYNGRISFFTSCGWAFSPLGHNAQNTCWYMRDDGYMYSYRYQISITELNNEPVSASLSLIDEGLVYGDRVYQFKVPDDLTDQVYTFDWYTKITAPPVSAYDGPLYVFYDTSGTPIVVRCKKGINYGRTNGPFIGEGVLSPEDPEKFTWQNAAQEQVGGAEVDGKTTRPTNIWDGFITYREPAQGTFYSGTIVMDIPDVAAVYPEGAEGWSIDHVGSSTSSVIYGQVIAVPLGDRESLLVWETRHISLVAVTCHYTRFDPFFRGTSPGVVYGGVITNCGPAPPGSVNYVSRHEPGDPGTPYSDWTNTGRSFRAWNTPYMPNHTYCGADMAGGGFFGGGGIPVDCASNPAYAEFITTLKTISSTYTGILYSEQEPVVTGSIGQFWDGMFSQKLWVACDAFSNKMMANIKSNTSEGQYVFNNSPYPKDSLVGRSTQFVGIP